MNNRVSPKYSVAIVEFPTGARGAGGEYKDKHHISPGYRRVIATVITGTASKDSLRARRPRSRLDESKDFTARGIQKAALLRLEIAFKGLQHHIAYTMSTFTPRDPTTAEKRLCERFWKHLKTTPWKVFGGQNSNQNCFGWALQVNAWLVDLDHETDELNEAFVYRTLREHGFVKVEGNTAPAVGEVIAVYRKGHEIVHFTRIVDGKSSSKLGRLWLISHEAQALYEGWEDGDYGIIAEYWKKGGAPQTLSVMEHDSGLTEDELVLVQDHAKQARQSVAPPKKTPPKTTPPKTTPPKTTPPKTTPPKTTPPKTTPPKTTPPKTTPPKTTPPKTTPPPNKPDNKLAAEFDKAFAAWLTAVEENPSSKTSAWLKVPAYANLKKLGAGIVPLLTDKLAKGELLAAPALRDIDRAKLQGKVHGSSLQQLAAGILKLEAAHASATKNTIAAFAERKDELSTPGETSFAAASAASASEEAKQKVLADPLFEAVVAHGHAAVPEILARLEHEHEHDPHGHGHDVWLEVLARIHAAEAHGDHDGQTEVQEFEAWLDKYVREEEEEEHHEAGHAEQ
ncbi:hypothetical protein F4680DRAFT_470700 [Xylaria scruposa]|nr:hypothetical protein F4680DRAFT_470700 [Xylaria scruposa]